MSLSQIIPYLVHTSPCLVSNKGMRNSFGRTSLMGSPPTTAKKSSADRRPMLSRARSLRSHVKAFSPESSPFTFHSPAQSSRKPPSPLKLPALYDHSRLDSLRLPKTDPPSPARHYALRRRFEGMSSKLDQIPNEDWLSMLLYCQPEFTGALASNIERCKARLAQSKLVKAAIREEDADMSDQSLRSLREERACV